MFVPLGHLIDKKKPRYYLNYYGEIVDTYEKCPECDGTGLLTEKKAIPE